MRKVIQGLSEKTEERAHAQHRAVSATPQRETPGLPSSLFHLQRTVGNRAVGRLIQAKLEVSQPGDIYEQEADRVADEVMRMPEPHPSHAATVSRLARPAGPQRACAECEENLQRKAMNEEEEDTIQAENSPGQSPEAGPEIEARIHSLRGNGQPLTPDVRSFFEPRFGHDFSGVRVHTDSSAAELAASLSANAFTFGRDIAFGAGQYNTESQEGRKLLSHELTHVVQQGAPAQNTQSAQRRAAVHPEEREAGAVSGQELGPKNEPLNGHSPSKVYLDRRQRRRVVRVPPMTIEYTPRERLLQAEDVAGIISEHLQLWYFGARFGIQNASLSGDDNATRWFLIALGGNLVWAATAFVNPAYAVAIRVMSVGGAVVGSGTMQQYFNEDLPIADFRTQAASMLGNTYQQISGQRADLTSALTDHLYGMGLTDRGDAEQTEQRRRAAWQFIFQSGIGYNDPHGLEHNAKQDVEAVWRHFLPCYQSLHTIITPDFIRRDLPRYTLVCYLRALVSSGVADRAAGVQRSAQYDIREGPGEIEMNYVGERYDFPGGASALRTRGMQHIWWGDLTATAP